MSCDIHPFIEVKRGGIWHLEARVVGHRQADLQSYALFGWLADVRNYSAIPPLAEERGIPADASPEVRTALSRHEELPGICPSFFTLAEFLAFDFDAPVENRRVTRQTGPNAFDGGCTCQPGEGEMTTYRELVLTTSFQTVLDQMAELGAAPRDVRLVFWFTE